MLSEASGGVSLRIHSKHEVMIRLGTRSLHIKPVIMGSYAAMSIRFTGSISGIMYTQLYLEGKLGSVEGERGFRLEQSDSA
ncbi:hypothetical protein Tco_0708980 [Tanacetum coccineum]